MFEEADTVLVQFRLPGMQKFPKVVYEDDPEVHTDRADRHRQTTGITLLERHGVVPSPLIGKLWQSGLVLIEVRSQERTNGVGKKRFLLTFVFGKTAVVDKERARKLSGEGMNILASFLERRWGTARVVQFLNKPTLRIVLFSDEVEHPQEFRIVEDLEARDFGIVVTKSTRG